MSLARAPTRPRWSQTFSPFPSWSSTPCSDVRASLDASTDATDARAQPRSTPAAPSNGFGHARGHKPSAMQLGSGSPHGHHAVCHALGRWATQSPLAPRCSAHLAASWRSLLYVVGRRAVWATRAPPAHRAGRISNTVAPATLSLYMGVRRGRAQTATLMRHLMQYGHARMSSTRAWLNTHR